jgi:hypothetical protein
MPLNAEQRAARNARRRERRAQDPEHRAKENAAHRAYYAANGEKMKARMRTYRETHRQQIKERRGAYCQANRAAINERARVARQARKQNNDPSLWNADLKRLYGISVAEYDALLAKQGGVCAICRQHSKRRLCVDHCHLTGTVRGLLCDRCNLGLGYLKEDQASLVAALAYLGALPRDGPGSAAQRALAVHGALPPWPTRRAVLTYPPVRCDAAPPSGGNTTSPMRDALGAELARASDGEKHNVLQLIARRLAVKALEGDLDAIREIFDRIDGKGVAGSARDVAVLSDRCLRSVPEVVLRR